MNYNNILNIYYKLEKELGYDIQISFDDIDLDSIIGTYKNCVFKLTYKQNAYVILSFKKDGLPFFNELIATISKIIKQKPICEYNLESKNKTIKTVEWNLINPKMRINAILGNKAWNSHTCQNIIIY